MMFVDISSAIAFVKAGQLRPLAITSRERSAIIPDLPFKPAVHVHYQETVLHMPDGLPKMKDVPAELGGSGETLPE